MSKSSNKNTSIKDLRDLKKDQKKLESDFKKVDLFFEEIPVADHHPITGEKMTEYTPKTDRISLRK